jgi:hypothetical protein
MCLQMMSVAEVRVILTIYQKRNIQLSNIPFSHSSGVARCSLCRHSFLVLVVGSHYGTAHFGSLQRREDCVRHLLLLSTTEWL